MTCNTEIIPSIENDFQTGGRSQVFDGWRESVREFYDVEPLSEGQSQQECLKAWLLSGLIISEVVFSPQMFVHDSRHAENANYLSLQIYRKGCVRGIFDDQSLKILPGEVHIFDFSREFYSTTTQSLVDGVVLSHEAVGYDPSRHPAHMKFDASTASGRFLIDAFYSLKRVLPSVLQSEASTLANGFCSLIRSYIAEDGIDDPEAKALRDERDREIRRYVDRHLSKHDLNASHICLEFNLSRSSLYRSFAETGGVGHYIARRRLERAFHQLLSSDLSRGRIQEVASHCGYEDAGYFSRLFRRHFGIAPSSVGLKRAETTVHSGHASARVSPISGCQLGLWLHSL